MQANEYTEDCLQKLSKSQLIAIVLSQRDETKATIESLRDVVKAINTNFKKLEADISIVKTINNLLMEKSVEIEQQCWTYVQYSRRECLEIAGIPTSIPLTRMILVIVIDLETKNERRKDCKQVIR